MDTEDGNDGERAQSLDRDVEAVVWSDNPEKTYFKQLIESAGMNRIEDGKDLDDSLVGVDTVASLMKDGDSLLGKREANTLLTVPPRDFDIGVGLEDDLSTIDGDTLNGSVLGNNKSGDQSSVQRRTFQEYTPPKKVRDNDAGTMASDDQTHPETPPGLIRVRDSSIPQKGAKVVPTSNKNHDPKVDGNNATGDEYHDVFRPKRLYYLAAVLGTILIAAIGVLGVSLFKLRRNRGSDPLSASDSTTPPFYSLTDSPTTALDPDHPIDPPLTPSTAPVPDPTQAPSRSPTSTPSFSPTQAPFASPTQALTTAPTTAIVMTVTSNATNATIDSTNATATNATATNATSIDPTLNPDNVTTIVPSTTPTTFISTITNSTADDLARADLLQTIATVSPQTIVLLENTDSVQFHAFEWLVNDPNYFDYDETRLIQRFVLSIFYLSLSESTSTPDTAHRSLDIGGSLLGDSSALRSGWMSYDDECTWYSFQPDFACNVDGSFRSIDIRNSGLVGTLPSELSLLSNSLRFLFLPSNHIHGSIPTEYGLLTNLERIQMTSNEMEGVIPSELGALTSVVVVGLGRNNLTGSIPSELGRLYNLHTLGLEGNSLTGNIPTEFGFLESLEFASLENNQLSGTIPLDLGSLSSLMSLSLNENNLVGVVPDEICWLTQNDLDILVTDCNIECDCCTDCERTRNPAPSSSPSGEMQGLPTTSAPSSLPSSNPSPTNFPTSSNPSPTNFPTLLPTTPEQAFPTSIPVQDPVNSTQSLVSGPTPLPSQKPTRIPTDSPTDNPTECDSSINSNSLCFLQGEGVELMFSNCYPVEDDWIGLYTADAQPGFLGNPLMWMWSCGAQRCEGAVGSATVVLDVNHVGQGRDATWPLNTGTYRAHLIRRGEGVFASSDPFDVDTDCR